MKKQSSLILLFILLLMQKVGYTENLYANSIFRSNELFTINETTGDVKKIGSIGFTTTDIAFYGSELYGITFSSFLKIDKTTAVGRKVGSLNFNSMNALVVSESGDIYAASTSNGDFIKIDVSTGKGTLIGNYGSGLTSSGDLAFDSNGILYASVKRLRSPTDWLAQVNRVSGEATLVGDIGFTDVWGLSFFDNILYGVTSSGKFIRINPLSGESTEISNNAVMFAGLTAYTNNCEKPGTGTVSPSLDINIHSLNYDSSQGILNIWANLEYLDVNSEEQHLWKLKDFGLNQPSCSGVSSIGTVSSNLDIHMPSLNFELLNLWANLEYQGINSEEQHIWRLKDFGNN